jgi:demethylspheroidene O-methyltransferase
MTWDGEQWPRPSQWSSVRDRLLSSRRFQRWAATFALTRPIARRRARDLFDLVAGFVYSQVLLACVRLHLFDILSEGPQSLSVLAGRLSLSNDAAERLLGAAVSLRLVAQHGHHRFGLGPLGAAMVGNRAVAAMVEHHALFYGDLRDPVALLRGERTETELARYWPYAGTVRPELLDVDHVAAYTALMSESQPLVAEEVLDAYPLWRHRCLLDVGGGDGTFLVAAAARIPALRVILFDLPPVADRASQRFAAAGLLHRASAVGGSFLSDPLPTGADIVSLIRVVHDHDDARVISILRAVRAVLPDDGTLLLAEPMSGAPGAARVGDAYFAFYLLAMGRGRARTADELDALLRAAGFSRIRSIPTRMPLQTGLIVARP